MTCKKCKYCKVIEGGTVNELFYFLCTLADRDMHLLYEYEHDTPYWCPLKKRG